MSVNANSLPVSRDIETAPAVAARSLALRLALTIPGYPRVSAHFLPILGAQTRKVARTLLLCTLAVAGPVFATSEARHPIQISYLGNAGWQISDGKVVILVDPNLSEFRKNAPAEQ